MGDVGPTTSLVLGRYALVKLIARGGMGTIYLARTEGAAGFRKPVVVKLIHPHLMHDAAAVRSFVREAKIAARLVHPNIVGVLDFGEHGGQYLTVLEYVHGYDLHVLSTHLAGTGRPMTLQHAAFVVHEMLRGLEYAQNARDDDDRSLGLVHRDISPHNVLLSTDGQVKLTDFGVARIRSEVTQSGKGEGLKGKLAYMAPEQVSGGVVDGRTDLFAVGIVLYEVLAGQRLFASEHEAQTILRVSEADVPDIRTLRPELPDRVAEILRKALARDPEDRYQDAASFAAGVRLLLEGKSPDEVEPSFRSLIQSTLREPTFAPAEGELPDVAAILKRPAIVLAEARPDRGSAPKERPAMPSPLALVALALGTALLVGGAALGALWIGGRDERGGPDRPVVGILDRYDPGGGDGGTTPSVADAMPDVSGSRDARRTDGSLPAEEAGAGVTTPTPAPLSGRVVTRTLGRRRAEIRRCIRTHRGQQAQATDIAIRVEIGGDGSVRAASVEPASIGGTPLGQCIAQVARSVRFPRHPEALAAFRVRMRVEVD